MEEEEKEEEEEEEKEKKEEEERQEPALAFQTTLLFTSRTITEPLSTPDDVAKCHYFQNIK